MSIVQSGTGNPTSDIQFAFEKLATVEGGNFSGSHVELKEVNLTFNFDTGPATLTIRNLNANSTFTFANSDEAWLQATFSGGDRAWDWGLDEQSLMDADFDTIARITDFENIIEATLNSTITLAEAGESGDSLSETGEFDELREGSVNPLFFDRYEGTGSWIFRVHNAYPVSFTITGSDDLSVTGTTPTSAFFTSVEYVLIPEPGSAALVLLLAGGGLAARRMVRRRRDWKGAPPMARTEDVPPAPCSAPDTTDDFSRDPLAKFPGI